MKKFKVIILFLCVLFQAQFVFAQVSDKKVTLYFFWGKGCPHCEKEKRFLKDLSSKYPDLEVKDFEIYEHPENRAMLVKMSKELNFNTTAIPVTIINKQYFAGFRDSITTGKKIEKAVIEEQYDLEHGNSINSNIKSTALKYETIKIPFFQKINMTELSLPLLSIALGAIDGFNPCAMWVLVMLLSFLIGIKDRKKLIILGSLFLLASAFVYFMVLVAWLNVMLFLAYITLIKIAIGIIAILAGGYYLKEFFTNKAGICKVTGSKQKRYISEKIEYFVKEKRFLLAACAVVVLAFLVNLIELICSAGIPAVYTQVLALSQLTTCEYYFYIFLYIFFFLLDDLIVFLIAIFSLRLVHVTEKYTIYSHLIGGVALLIIGALLIFKPEWLMFG